MFKGFLKYDKMILFKGIIKGLLLVTLLFSANVSEAQIAENVPKQKSEFWNRVRFGGGIGLGFGSGYTNIVVAPGAVYEFNKYVSAGLGLQGSYISVREQYKSFIYGASIISLFHPIEQIQLSAELEQVRVNAEYDFIDANNASITENFWNPALFLGVGYRMNGLTVGVRYNVLFNEKDRVYADAFMPFVRVFF